MFDWIDKELAMVKTNKFHLVDGTLSKANARLVRQSQWPLPPSYRAFVRRFGYSRLYRRRGSHLVQIYPVPFDAVGKRGEKLLHFGRTDAALAYFDEADLELGTEAPVYEWRHGQGLQKTADDFVEWLETACARARKRFGKREWQAILQGPERFTTEEAAIASARTKFRWKLLDFNEQGLARIEIKNDSELVLPYFTIAVHTPDGRPFGEVPIVTGDIPPGRSAVVEANCYREYLQRDQVCLKDTLPLGPEDRDLYQEFAHLRAT